MREFQAPVKFLVWIISIVMVLGLLGQLPKLTYKAAEMAIDAHQNHQMSYGQFSRQLWSKKQIEKK